MNKDRKQETKKTEFVGHWQKLEKKEEKKKLQTTFAFAAY